MIKLFTRVLSFTVWGQKSNDIELNRCARLKCIFDYFKIMLDILNCCSFGELFGEGVDDLKSRVRCHGKFILIDTLEDSIVEKASLNGKR